MNRPICYLVLGLPNFTIGQMYTQLTYRPHRSTLSCSMCSIRLLWNKTEIKLFYFRRSHMWNETEIKPWNKLFRHFRVVSVFLTRWKIWRFAHMWNKTEIVVGVREKKPLFYFSFISHCASRLSHLCHLSRDIQLTCFHLSRVLCPWPAEVQSKCPD